MRAGAVHLASQQTLTFEQGLQLKREWQASNAGAFLYTPSSTRHLVFQFRPDVLTARALLDVRVRRALAHSLDKATLATALWEGEGAMLDSFFPPDAEYYPAIDRVITKYPYDLRATERLMAEAGFARGSDGVYVSPAEGRLAFDFRATVGQESETERSTGASGWRQAGFDVSESTLGVAQFADGQARASFEGISTNTQSAPELTMSAAFTTAQAARPENRWNGTNRGAWSNADYDRAVEAFNTVLDTAERTQQRANLARILSEEVPTIMLYYNLVTHPRLAALTWPGNAGPLSTLGVGWNIHEWTLGQS
jgi:peptide/nickel transport system substrate-binding protein